jgi:hypothetical protein
MSTGLVTMRDEVKLAIGSRTDITDPMVDNWLNISQLALASRLRIFEIEAAVTFALIPATDIYGQPLNFWSTIVMVNTSVDRQLIRLKPIESILTQPISATGRVTQFGLRAKSLIFRPVPTTADTLEWTYKKRPSTMTSLVNLTLPDEFGPAVVFDAIVRALYLTGEEDRAAIYREHRDDVLAGIGDQRGEEFAQREEGVIMAGMNPAVRLA